MRYFFERLVNLAFVLSAAATLVSYINTVLIPIPWLKVGALLLMILFLVVILRVILFLTGELPIANTSILLGYSILTYQISCYLYYFFNPAYEMIHGYLRDQAWNFIVYPVLFSISGETFGQSNKKKLAIFATTAILITFMIIIGTYLSYRENRLFFMKVTPLLPRENYFEFYYHIVGDTLSIVGLLLVTSELIQPFFAFFIYLVTSALLILSLSRTSLFLFTPLGIYFIYKKLKFKNSKIANRILFITFIVLLLNFTVIFISMFVHQILGPAFQRIAFILEGTDPSLLSRIELLNQFKKFLQSEYIISGHFVYEAFEGAGIGKYVHNFLSFWMSYGLIPFLLLIFWIISIPLKLKVVAQKDPHAYLARKALFLFALLAIVLSRSYLWSFMWFCFFYASSYPKPLITNENKSLFIRANPIILNLN